MAARQPAHEGCLPQGGPFDAFNKAYVHRGVYYTDFFECAGYGSPNPIGGGSGCEARQEDPEPCGLLDDLPPRGGGLVQNVVEHDWMDTYFACFAWELQDVFDAPFDVLQNGEGASAGAAPSAQSHGVGHFVADQRQRAGEQDCDEELGSGCSRRHGFPFWSTGSMISRSS